MKFNHVTLSVSNLEASLRFYQEIVGLEIILQFSAGPGRDIAILGSGDTEVELIGGADNNDNEMGKGVSLGFLSESLEDTIALLRSKGYATDGNILSPMPGISFFFASDPDGYTVQFMKVVNQ